MGLTAADLRCSRAGRPVLDGVGFALADGEALVLRGPNGAGKSTLLRVLAGLLPADAGEVTLDGVQPGRDADAWAERVAYVGHLDAVKPQLTVVENLGFWAALYGGEVGAALEAFGLAAIADRPAQVCSAGQKRRIGLARLLLAPRPLWLLDEPTVALDEAATERLMAALRAHGAGGGIAVIATHAALGLEGARTLRLAPLAEASARAAVDPFLAGHWG